MHNEEWNYLDLFSGIGGFHEGLKQADFKFEWTGFSEIDKYAKKIYQNHFPESEDLGDVRTITVDRLPKGKSILTGGFPCQDLSIAGKRKGLAGHRSGLFFEIVRILIEWQPDIFILENVLGLLISNERRDFETVIREIADIGVYYAEWQVLNTKQFLPQNRERVFIIGRHIRNGCPEAIFPFGEGSGVPTRKNDECKWLSENGEGIAYSLDAHFYKGVANQSRTMIACQKKIRRLTPVECERLQGFKDGWTEGISDTQRYGCLGNAVSVPVVREIGSRLLEAVCK